MGTLPTSRPVWTAGRDHEEGDDDGSEGQDHLDHGTASVPAFTSEHLGESAERLVRNARRRMTAPAPGEPSKPDDLTFVLFRLAG